MSFLIALAGKGGTGKTSIASLIVRYLLKNRRGPVLAVDADSNTCLNEALGEKIHATVGQLRESSLEAVRSGDNRPGGMSMEELFEYQINQALIESKGFDLLVMGRPEGPGCYCAANNIIRKYTDILSERYPYVIIDNEAGMEHLSRRTTNNVNLLLIISDSSVKGIQTAKRISDLVDELKLNIETKVAIINRVIGEEGDKLKNLAESLGLSVAGLIPQDSKIFEYDLQGRPIIELPEDSPAIISVFSMLDSLDIL